MVANLNSFVSSGLTPVKQTPQPSQPTQASQTYTNLLNKGYTPSQIATITNMMKNSSRNINSQILPIPEVVYNPIGSVIHTIENISETTNPLLQADKILTNIQDRKFWYTIIAIIVGVILIIISVQGFIYSEGIGSLVKSV